MFGSVRSFAAENFGLGYGVLSSTFDDKTSDMILLSANFRLCRVKKTSNHNREFVKPRDRLLNETFMSLVYICV